MRLHDRVVLITGGGSGIGRAIAELFAAEGAIVAVADKNSIAAAETVDLIETAGGRALSLVADISVSADVISMVNATIDRFGRVDILINNAAVAVGNTVLDLDETQWDLNLDIVLKGTYLCSKAVLPVMIERRAGVILNIASVNGLLAVGEAAYSAAKAGVINLTANLAIHFGEHGIRVNCIAPGTVRTPVWNERIQKSPDILERLVKWYPLGRIGEPDDIAKAALFLCSDDASWITGSTLTVDGGLTCGSHRLSREVHGFEKEPPTK